jgi:hypothetical protein
MPVRRWPPNNGAMGVFWRQFRQIGRIILSHGPSAPEEAQALHNGRPRAQPCPHHHRVVDMTVPIGTYAEAINGR